MSRVRRGILASFADKYLSQLIALVTVAVMSRILSPAEIGLFLVANSVIMLADNFRTFGVGIYIVQVPELRRESVQSAFTVTLAMSLVIGLGILASAGPIARFYDEQNLAHLLRVAVLAFCTIPFASPILALMQRDLAFGTMAWLNVATALVNAAVTVTLAMLGLGPVSYVWGYVASSSFLSLGCIALRPDLGIFRPSLRDARHIMTFGGVSTAVTLVNMANDMLPRLAFAKIIGFDAAGLYGRALTLCQLPDRAVLSALQPVVLPAMAAHARAGGELKTVYLKGLALVTAVQWPVLLMLALLADPVVRVILGPQWELGRAVVADHGAGRDGACAGVHDVPGAGQRRAHPGHVVVQPGLSAAVDGDHGRGRILRHERGRGQLSGGRAVPDVRRAGVHPPRHRDIACRTDARRAGQPAADPGRGGVAGGGHPDLATRIRSVADRGRRGDRRQRPWLVSGPAPAGSSDRAGNRCDLRPLRTRAGAAILTRQRRAATIKAAPAAEE